jgi:hypothetical protein
MSETLAAPPAESAVDSAAKVILKRGRARPLWFGHPWVYANAVDRVEGSGAAGAPRGLVVHHRPRNRPRPKKTPPHKHPVS